METNPADGPISRVEIGLSSLTNNLNITRLISIEVDGDDLEHLISDNSIKIHGIIGEISEILLNDSIAINDIRSIKNFTATWADKFLISKNTLRKNPNFKPSKIHTSKKDLTETNTLTHFREGIIGENNIPDIIQGWNELMGHFDALLTYIDLSDVSQTYLEKLYNHISHTSVCLSEIDKKTKEKKQKIVAMMKTSNTGEIL